MPPDEAIYDTVTDINASIYNAALNSTAFEGMATTLVIGWFLGGRLWVAHTETRGCTAIVTRCSNS